MTKQQDLVQQSIELLPEQCLQAWNEAQKVVFDQNYQDIKNVVICGMGGSGLPTHFINSVFATRVPVHLVNGYDLPYWAHEQTLVVLSSYSGDTEETLSCLEQAQRHHCLIAGITSGGKLAEWFKDNRYPAFIFNPINNPSKKPRLGLGYMIFGELSLLYSLKLIVNVGPSMREDVLSSITHTKQQMKVLQKQGEKIAEKFKNKLIVVFGADHLAGNAHIAANQINESGKSLVMWYVIPEANHHLFEGLKHPGVPLGGLFLESTMYLESIKKRFKLTRELFEKSGAVSEKYQLKGDTILAEALETLIFTSWLSFYLAQVYKEDPLSIPTVDWFKKQLEI